MAADKPKKNRDLLGKIWVGMIALLFLIMLYGAIRFPYPIQYRDGGYFNTQSQRVTEADYRSQNAWERVLAGAFGLTGLVIVILLIRDRRKKKRR